MYLVVTDDLVWCMNKKILEDHQMTFDEMKIQQISQGSLHWVIQGRLHRQFCA